MKQLLNEYYGTVFEDKLLQEIAEVGVIKHVQEGDKIMDIGNYIKSMPLVLDGAIKILREDNDGDELLLYFLEKGDTCAMTLSCCLGDVKSQIKAVAALDATLLMIPIQKMEEWTVQYKSWRNFVFDRYHNRLMEMLNTIDSIAFMKMDERLINYLKNKQAVINDTLIKSTHQEIAYELHTSRVVISRLLKSLENQGKIKLYRNYLEIISLE